MTALFETLFDGAGELFGDGIQSILEMVLNATIFKIFYYLERALCYIINILSQLFDVFSGVEKVTYAGENDYLINIFFTNSTIRNIYLAMAAIGMVMTVGFTIWALIKKIFDISDKEQRSIGQILTASFRSIVLIVGLTLIMSAVIYGTNILMKQVNFIFNNAKDLDEPPKHEFTEEEYSAMGRVLLTIGNYSLVNTSNNRYNLNMCFNDIRSDMYFLQQKGVFNYYYYDTDKDGNEIESWQSVLSRIAKSTNLSKDVTVDQYHEELVESLTYAMNYLKNNKIVTPVTEATKRFELDEDFHLDRMVFLMGTLNAAYNEEYNKTPAFDDALRGPYYYEKGKSIYNADQVTSDFDIGFRTDYILVWIASVACIFDLVVIIMNCVARIFNMIFLYIIAPPFIAAAPLDQGGKFKQWSIAFLIQALSVFGTIIAMRLLMIYLPIVMDPELILFEKNKYLNIFGKFVLVLGGFEVAKKATGLLTGILADSAGWQSISAGDMSSAASKAIGTAVGAGRTLAGTAVGAGKFVGGKALGVAGFVARPLTNRITHPFKQAAEAWSKLGTKGSQDRNYKNIQEKINQAKYQEQYLKNNPEDAKWLTQGNNANNNNNNNDNNNNNNNNPAPQNNQNPVNNQNNNNQPDRNNNVFAPPPLPNRRAVDDGNRQGQPGQGSRNLRHRFGFDEPLNGPGNGPAPGNNAPGQGPAGQGGLNQQNQHGGQGGNGPQGPQRPANNANRIRRSGSFSGQAPYRRN